MELISKIGLGTVQFGTPYGIGNSHGMTSEDEVYSLLTYAKEQGINLLDTAAAYGRCEEVLGYNNLQGFKIISKFLLDENNQSIEGQLKNSLKRLKVASLYGYLAHRPTGITTNPKYWDDLIKLKEKGIVQKIGFSFNELSEVEAVLSLGIVPDLVQVPFNYLDNRFLPYMIELKSKGCEIQSRSTFLQGLLFCDPNRLSDYFCEVKPIITELQKNGDQLPGMLLRYCLEKPYIDKVVIGVNTLEQLIDNIGGITTVKHLETLTVQLNEAILTPSKWPENGFTNL